MNNDEFVCYQISQTTAEEERNYFYQTAPLDPVEDGSAHVMPPGEYRVIDGQIYRIVDGTPR